MLRVIMCLVMSLIFTHPAKVQTLAKMYVHFIDVGQGSAMLIEFSENECGAILIDTGGERVPSEPWKDAKFSGVDNLVKYLDAFFDRRTDLNNQLELLILTHPHVDHTRGVPIVLEKYRPKNIVHNGQSTGSGGAEQVQAREYAIDDDDIAGWYVLNRTIGPQKGLTNSIIDPINCVGVDPEITALWGQVRNDDDWDAGDFSDPNNHSVVIRVDFADASILFTGDIEEHKGPFKREATIERMVDKFKSSDLLKADVLYVGHHGSHNGNSDDLVSAVSPEIAVISSGPSCRRGIFTAWNFGHPRKETINELETGITKLRDVSVDVDISTGQRKFEQHTIQKAIYNTGWDGTIVLEADSNGDWKVNTLTGTDKSLCN